MSTECRGTSSPASQSWGEQTDKHSFIEVQFPVSKLSKESYKERKAGSGQTLTGLGKWWGRKPLVLVRAILLGLLMPASANPKRDMETFLALMTMDDDGMLRRFSKPIPAEVVYEHTPGPERRKAFELDDAQTPSLTPPPSLGGRETGTPPGPGVRAGKPRWRPGLSAAERRRYQIRALRAMSYDERLKYLKRPEEIDGPSPEAWQRINAHLGTSARSLPELVRELGERRFGHVPRVGDVFCGGGSIPFEAARLGCEAYGSDLNPVAALLTWGALNIAGGGEEAVRRVRAAQGRVFRAVQEQVDAWGIERNEEGWVADAYLYCNEVRDPATGWWVPLAPSWVIGRGSRTIARLVPLPDQRRFAIEIVSGVSATELDQADQEGTWADGVRCPVDREGNWLPPAQRQVTTIEQLRGPGGLRRWENDDLVPRPDDVFQERLYCIRWVNPKTDERVYRAPDASDLAREERVLALLRERFARWQAQGYLPSRRIEPGYNTDQPIRERGWTHWHHLFNPRQLLLAGLFSERIATEPEFEARALLLMLGRIANWSSRLSVWDVSRDLVQQTYLNQALNTLANYGCRSLATSRTAFCAELSAGAACSTTLVEPIDARSVDWEADIWITDPGYADAVNYEELSEFFLAWYEGHLPRLFPGWPADSRRALAVKGRGESFRVALSECYRRLAQQMPDDGYQVVMFTHQDPEVWADVGLTLWAAGLQVTAAWTVATETTASGLKQGNYVQGTVVLVLRKRREERRGDLTDLYPDIQAEVRRQIETMLALDDKEEPNFGDADYQLAAYAAALRVLTGYSSINQIDVQKELRRRETTGNASPLVQLIREAVRIASDYLVPPGLDRGAWRKLSPEERLYLKGIQVEASGEARQGIYQELARGYGAGPHKELYASRAANQVRFKTPSEFGSRDLQPGSPGFAGSLLRQLLFAVAMVVRDAEHDPREARTYLRRELEGYWEKRQLLADLLRFLETTAERLPHWAEDVRAARLLRESLLSDAM